MKPAGNVLSVLVLPSTLTKRCIMIIVTSFLVRAYLSLFLSKMTKGKLSLNLCGPELGLGALINKYPKVRQ